MDVLEEWLGSTIERELKPIIQSKLQGGSGFSGEVRCQDDGSNLRVKSSTKGVVQIAKVLLFPK